MIAYPFLLTATLAIETPIAAALRGRAAVTATLRTALAANLFTHPSGTLAYADLQIDWWVVEAAVTLVEAMLYRIGLGTSWCRSATMALAANTTTATIGRCLGGG